MMPSQPDALSDDGSASYLGDSAYEILTDSTILTSDDEDNNTDEATSVNGHGPEDVASLGDTESHNDSDGEPGHEHEHDRP